MDEVKVYEYNDNDGDDSEGRAIIREWWECSNCHKRFYHYRQTVICPICRKKLRWE